MPSIITIRYSSTNCYFIDTGDGLLAFDAGWPGTYRLYKDALKAEGYRVTELKWLLVSHFHLDHAGLAGLLQQKGVRLILFENQPYAIDAMEQLIGSKGMDYQRIDRSAIEVLSLSESRRWLASIGLQGEVIQTNGHGEDHISLVLDSGEAFIGDLIPDESMASPDDRNTLANWAELKRKGARRIYPAHAGFDAGRVG